MIRNLRMLTGSCLYLLVTSHLLNMAFGLFSVEATDAASAYLTAPWTFPPLSLLVMLSFLVHTVLGLHALYHRSTLRMSGYDGAQLVFGLLIVPLLASHVIGIYAVKNFFQFEPTYRFILTYFWLDNPLEGLRQVLVVIVIWIHGSIGIFSWIRLKSWWDRLAWMIYPLFVAVPVLALLGFVDAGNEVISDAAIVAEEPAAPPVELTEAEQEAAAEQQAEVLANLALANRIFWITMYIYGAMVIAAFVLRWLRLRARRHGLVVIDYLRGPTIEAETGASLLELSRISDLPHANLCRGRGRCGTCRVRILETQADLNEPTQVERQTLARLNAPDDVRLACQLQPQAGRLTVERLVAPDISPKDMVLRQKAAARADAAEDTVSEVADA